MVHEYSEAVLRIYQDTAMVVFVKDLRQIATPIDRYQIYVHADQSMDRLGDEGESLLAQTAENPVYLFPVDSALLQLVTPWLNPSTQPHLVNALMDYLDFPLYHLHYQLLRVPPPPPWWDQMLMIFMA